MPNAWLIPNRATPMVAMVVHELPIMTETMAQITQAVTRKNRGEIIWMP